MAEYLIRNSLNPSKVVSCALTFRQITNKGEEGENVWLVQLGTSEPHKDGGEILPRFVHLTSLDNLDEEIREATEAISVQVDWGTLVEDNEGPHLEAFSPTGSVVDISSNVTVDLKEDLPSAGIDPNSISITVNGIDVSNELEIDGTPFDYNIVWRPAIRILDYY
jgi:hypothetical protein